MEDKNASNRDSNQQEKQRSRRLLIGATVLAAVAAIAITALLVNIFERKQEAKNPFYRVVELNDTIDDPAVWGKTSRSSTTATKKPLIKSAPSTAAVRLCRRRPPTPIPALLLPAPNLSRTRASKPCGRATLSALTTASAEATPICWTIRPTPGARRRIPRDVHQLPCLAGHHLSQDG